MVLWEKDGRERGEPGDEPKREQRDEQEEYEESTRRRKPPSCPFKVLFLLFVLFVSFAVFAAIPPHRPLVSLRSSSRVAVKSSGQGAERVIRAWVRGWLNWMVWA